MQDILPSLSELQLQANCYQWAYGTYPAIRRLLWHVPNETKPFPGEPKQSYYMRLNKMKASGLLKGVHDLHLYWRGVLHTFELKVDYNKQSDEQKAFGAAIVSQGGKTYEIRDVLTFQNFFRAIMNEHCS